MANSEDERLIRLYISTLPNVPPRFADLLERYSRIPKGPQQINHITSLRDRAYKLYPYPCLGHFRFVDLDLSNHPLYQTEVLPRLTASTPENECIFLDFGTCVGQDIRQLLNDGVSASNVYGSDIEPGFIDVGYELFQDEKIFPRSHFLVPADAFDLSAANPLSRLNEKVTVLHISAVFHLFSLDKQHLLARRCLRLLNRSAGKCLILGGQTANINAGEYTRAPGKTRYRHNAESWRDLWEQAAREDGACKVHVDTILQEGSQAVKGRVQQQLMESDDTRGKVIGFHEEGFRWSIWWVWVEF